tara:strand:- start:844 stop:1029 length:186 start_codon:yes stop_codon:yes gene_type:complete
MKIGDLIKTKANRSTAQVNLPRGFGIITEVASNQVVYVQWANQPKPRPVNTVYLEVINENR